VQNPERDFPIKFSALEIYNEVVKDLLHTDSGPLRLLDDPEVRGEKTKIVIWSLLPCFSLHCTSLKDAITVRSADVLQ